MFDADVTGPFVGRDFLPPAALLKVLAALERLSGHWRSSEEMGLVGRGGASQVRGGDLAVQPPLDEIRRELAPAALQWALRCGFRFESAPQLQLFPVRMVGDRRRPAGQEPHVDSLGEADRTPICTNVFYARVKAAEGGALAVARPGSTDLADPFRLIPAANTIASFPGDTVHWVEPLYAGERVSVVVNLY